MSGAVWEDGKGRSSDFCEGCRRLFGFEEDWKITTQATWIRLPIHEALFRLESTGSRTYRRAQVSRAQRNSHAVGSFSYTTCFPPSHQGGDVTLELFSPQGRARSPAVFAPPVGLRPFRPRRHPHPRPRRTIHPGCIPDPLPPRFDPWWISQRPAPAGGRRVQGQREEVSDAGCSPRSSEGVWGEDQE